MITEVAPDWWGDTVGSILQTIDETNVEGAEAELSKDLWLHVNTEEAIAHGGYHKTEETEPDRGDAHNFTYW